MTVSMVFGYYQKPNTASRNTTSVLVGFGAHLHSALLSLLPPSQRKPNEPMPQKPLVT